MFTSSVVCCGVRQHGDLAPDAGAAFAHALHAGVEGAGLAAIFVGDLQQRGADDALLGGVAVETIARFHEREAGIARLVLALGASERRC